MNRAVTETARIWTWSHRWFRSLQKEEFRVDIAPSGEFVRFVHLLPDSAAGADLGEDEARLLAERFLRGIRPEGVEDLRFLGATVERRDHRSDHLFTWERARIDWAGGRYRHRVTIQGDRPGGYEEFVKVPEEWSRDYARLRSKNDVAGSLASTFLIKTCLVMIVVLFLQARKRRIRWRFAEIFGLVGAILVFLASMNGLPQALYRYETTTSFGGFLTETILVALISAIGAGLLILVLVAAGENQYRTRYQGKISLPAMFTWRGLRTKEFLFTAIGGICLSCLFLAYQTVFYRVASSFGAWSPAEVPYDDLLNSALPWAFLLFIGFFPAVTEEFLSRSFSVPFFSRIFRSRILAVLLASAIWGFGHSTYPNQPFYIRGVELLIAGALMSVLMIRFNLGILLVWHYTIDAVYSGYLLFRSGNPYYVTTGAIACGVMVLPLLIAIAAYLRTGRFADPELLRHRADPFPEEAAPAAPPPVPVVSASRLGRRGMGAAAVTGLIALCLSLLVSSGLDRDLPESPVRVDRARATARAAAFVRERGVDPARFQSVVRVEEEVDPDAVRYVQAHAGLGRVADLWPGSFATHSWSVRYFEPLEVEEVRVRIDVASGRVIAFDHRIAEEDSLPTPTEAAAESLANALLESVDRPATGMERKEAAEEPRPKRVDRRFAWEAVEGDPRNVAEARYRLEATVTGDHAAGFEERLRLPEEYTREREKRTALWGIALTLVLAGSGAILGLTIREAFRSPTTGPVAWKRNLPVGIAAVLVSVFAILNSLPRMIFRYESSVPWGNFAILIAVGLELAVVLYFFFGWVGVGLAQRLHRSVGALWDRSCRRQMLPGALLALVVVPVWAILLGKLPLLLAAWFPRIAPPPPMSVSPHLETTIPALGVVTTVVPRTFLFGLAIAILVRLFRSQEWPGRRIRIILFAILLVGLSLLPARGVGEFLITLMQIITLVGVGVGLALFLLRDNPLAYLTAAYGITLVGSVGELLAQPDSWARGHAIASTILLLLPVLWLVLDARREPGGSGSIDTEP